MGARPGLHPGRVARASGEHVGRPGATAGPVEVVRGSRGQKLDPGLRRRPPRRGCRESGRGERGGGEEASGCTPFSAQLREGRNNKFIRRIVDEIDVAGVEETQEAKSKQECEQISKKGKVPE
ncbi:hypothetical protein P7K49_029383 [Saguinus oedipus]|uniref:Uncharacterized protein n=1 Tax=Saguinus oedipus TaxID=9490 RepID=A0ABQ9U709_SAGOE|nr:hypothetical protein P7K49_029383 [Saguinus oedipus]